MVSEKPPRHSRPKKDPVTIDLEARNETPETPAEAPVEEGLAEPVIPETSAEPVSGAFQAPEEPQAQPAAEPATESTMDEPAEAASSAPLEPEPVIDAAPASVEPRRETASPAFASLAAVGILGGLIALAGAGALQYGGFLPGLGPDERPVADTSSLSSDMATLKAEVARLSTVAPSAPDSGLEQRLADLEAAAANTTENATSAAEIDALEAALAQSTADIAALKSELDSVREAQASATSSIETRLSEAETKLEAPQQDVIMAHAIAVSALKTAIDRGGPFLGELNTLAGVKPDDAAVAALQPYAAAGISSRAELTRRFPAVADEILAAINQPAAGGSWSDRLISSAMSVVKVRPVGNVEGDTPEAIVARMEDKLQNGDIKGAALEWDSLPEAGKAASTEFQQMLQTRIEVEDIVSNALTNAVAGQG